ncbi:MAG TPA: hypothetical protein VIY69_13445 [Candidatus Acidoferrales bacterium]
MCSLREDDLPDRYSIDEEINWDAPWIGVSIWVELPFWLMVEDSTLSVDVGGHNFAIETHEHYFELHAGGISDSKQHVLYQGPPKKQPDLMESVRNVLSSHPEADILWRKSKTVLKIKSRCNEFVWDTRNGTNDVLKNARFPMALQKAIDLYLTELCRAHIPVVNTLIQQYRLATYDYFAYEVSPWDVSFWLVERNAKCVRVGLVPYRDWDIKPRGYAQPPHEIVDALSAGDAPTPPTLPYKLIEINALQDKMSFVAGPGEFDLLDSLNLMERGDYSGAVRRITTALEVIVENLVAKAIAAVEGKSAATKFVQTSKTNFRMRLEKLERLTGRALPDPLKRQLFQTRTLRHKIVHQGYRIGPSERGLAQHAVDTGRWTYNWFENDAERFDVREKKIAFRGLGRDLTAGVFPTKITAEGVVVSKIPV